MLIVALLVVSTFILASLRIGTVRGRSYVTKFASAFLSASLLVAIGFVPSAMASPSSSKLTITNSVHSAFVGTHIKVEASGGSGHGNVTFEVKGKDCSIKATSGLLRARAATRCVVTAMKAESTGHPAQKSKSVNFFFRNRAQATLTISNTTLTGVVGSTIMVTTAGGSGNGELSFSATGNGCTINATTGALSASIVSTCVVTAIKAASAGFQSATSASVDFAFGNVAQATLSITNSTRTGTVGTPITVTAAGGSGSGAVTFAVTGTGCSINATTGSLSASAAATCAVQASKAASTGYNAATSTAVNFVFSAAVVSGPDNPTVAHPDVAAL